MLPVLHRIGLVDQASIIAVGSHSRRRHRGIDDGAWPESAAAAVLLPDCNDLHGQLERRWIKHSLWPACGGTYIFSLSGHSQTGKMQVSPPPVRYDP